MKKAFICITSFFLVILTFLTISSCRQSVPPVKQMQSSILIPSQEAKDVGDWSLDQVFLHGDKSLHPTVSIQECVQDKKTDAILLLFWASWGEPEDILLDYYEELYHQYNNKGLIIFGISIDLKNDNLLKAIQNKMLQHEVSYPILWDYDNSVKNSYNIGAIPVTYLIDKQGKIRYEHSGFTSEEIDIPPLEEAINFLLKKK